MGRTRLAAVAVGFGLALAGGLSGCTASQPGPSTGTSPSASGTGTAGSDLAGCVVGTWRSTGFTATMDAGGVRGTANGGSGVKVTVAPDGKAVVDFAGMQPVTFSTRVSDTDVKGQFVYGGLASGPVRLNSAGPGTWQPAGPVDFGAVTVTVDLMTPVQAKVIDKARLGDFVASGNNQTGNTVDPQPILREGTYQCSGNTLTLGPPRGSTVGGTWTLERVSS